MFETNFSGPNKIWGAQKNLGTQPLNAPMATESLYFCASFLTPTCHKCYWSWWTDGL